MFVNPCDPWPMSDAAWKAKYGRLRLGAIVFDDGRVTPLDWRDLMWAVRAVRGEAGYFDSAGIETDAILWTMTNRLRLQADESFGRGAAAHAPPHRLHHMLLAYCAPINPFQRDRGDAATQARRAAYATMGPDKVDRGQTDPGINPASTPRVVAFLRGQVSRTPWMRYVDFAACDCEGCGRDTHGPEDLRLGDCFWIGPGGRSLNEQSVRIAPPRSRDAGAAVAGVGLVLGTAGALYLAR